MTWIAVAGLARAQEPVTPEPGGEDDPSIGTPAPVAPVFNADKVLVSTFQAEDAASEADAQRLFALLAGRFASTNEVVTMAEVPRFEPQGYDAAQYMLGCPPGRYAGCALILGQRATADRVVGATVRRDPDEFDAAATVLVMTVHVVDVAEAREIASFGMPIPPDREADTVEAVARMFDDVVAGEYALRDLRERGETPDDVAMAKARTERMAEALAAMEAELGTAVRSAPVGTLEAPRVTRDDLAEYANRDDTPPWQRVSMTEDQYLRFANSGQDLTSWRRTGWGRFGKVLGRVSGGFSNGPWHQSYAGEVLLSSDTLQPVQTVQVLEVVNASSAVGDFELGFGVAPFVDLMFAAATRTGQTRYTVDEDVEGQVAIPSGEDRFAMSTWQLGARVQLAPFPRWRARPTVAVGLARWTGAGIPATERFERLDAPNATLFELLPGFEVDATPALALSLRVMESIPIGGTVVRTTETGASLIADPPAETGDRGPGIGVQLGFLVRVGPVFEPPSPKARYEDDEDEP